MHTGRWCAGGRGRDTQEPNVCPFSCQILKKYSVMCVFNVCSCCFFGNISEVFAPGCWFWEISPDVCYSAWSLRHPEGIQCDLCFQRTEQFRDICIPGCGFEKYWNNFHFYFFSQAGRTLQVYSLASVFCVCVFKKSFETFLNLSFFSCIWCWTDPSAIQTDLCVNFCSFMNSSQIRCWYLYT